MSIAEMALPAQTATPAATSTACPTEPSSSLLTTGLLIDIPVIKAVIEKSESVWENVKEKSRPAKWTLNAAEFTVRNAVNSARILAWPFQVPIGIVDRALSGRIIEAEKKWPVLKESPNKVVEAVTQAVRARMESWYVYAGSVAADGKRAVTAVTDSTRNLCSAVQTSVKHSLTDFEEIVDEMASRPAGQSRVVEGQSSSSSEARGPASTSAQRWRLARRALESGLYLYVGAVVCTLSAVPLARHFAKTLREYRGPQPQAEDPQQASRAASTSEQLMSSSIASIELQTVDETEMA